MRIGDKAAHPVAAIVPDIGIAADLRAGHRAVEAGLERSAEFLVQSRRRSGAPRCRLRHSAAKTDRPGAHGRCPACSRLTCRASRADLGIERRFHSVKRAHLAAEGPSAVSSPVAVSFPPVVLSRLAVLCPRRRRYRRCRSPWWGCRHLAVSSPLVGLSSRRCCFSPGRGCPHLACYPVEMAAPARWARLHCADTSCFPYRVSGPPGTADTDTALPPRRRPAQRRAALSWRHWLC